jgi:hypothetical protein
VCLLFDVLVLLFRLFCLLSRAVDLSVYVSTSWLHLHVNKLLNYYYHRGVRNDFFRFGSEFGSVFKITAVRFGIGVGSVRFSKTAVRSGIG